MRWFGVFLLLGVVGFYALGWRCVYGRFPHPREAKAAIVEAYQETKTDWRR